MLTALPSVSHLFPPSNSIPVTNGMVHQPVFSHLKVHEMAPRNFATKAKVGVVPPPQPVNGTGTEEKSNLKQNSVQPNGNHNTIGNGKNNTPIDAKTDSPKQVITNGGGKKPISNGGNKSPEGTDKEVVKKLNAVNGKHNGKPESKTVYTKRLEETFIF